MSKDNKVVIYKDNKGETQLEVKLEKETLWLSQKQMAFLFGKDVRTINEHIGNVFKEKELDPKAVIRNFRITAKDGKSYNTKHYDLDVIISVGYRVKSVQGTQFRIWANRVLKRYLLEGYVINQKLLEESQEKLRDLQETISFFSGKVKDSELKGQEKELFSILEYYSSSISVLGKYDAGKLRKPKGKIASYSISYPDAYDLIVELKRQLISRKEASNYFGNEIENRFKGALGSINQTFDSVELYRTIEEKAANLLYFVIKDHPFSDGNKRIGSILFVYFLEKNNHLFRHNGERKINDSALVALAILTASSDPKDKETIVKLIMGLIKD